MNKILQILWGIFLFTFPFSIRKIIYEPFDGDFTLFNPWVTGFLYLPEILLVIVFLLYLFGRIQDSGFRIQPRYSEILLILFLFNAGLISFLFGDFGLFFFWFLRILEVGMVVFLISEELLPGKMIIKILLSGALFQLFLGTIQSHLNHSIGLWFLGESVLGSDVLNVAKVNLAEGIKQIRPYGTFLHPNILAAYLMTILFLAWNFLKGKERIVWSAVLVSGIFFTQSRAAILVTLICFGLIYLTRFFSKKQIIIGLASILFLFNFGLFFGSSHLRFSDSSWQARVEQNQISYSLLTEKPFGVGVSNFTNEISNGGSDWGLEAWEIQPVHNTYFLVLNETGIQGFLILLAMIGMFFWKHTTKTLPIALIALLLIAPFDHYLWDSFVGLMLIGIVIGFFCLEPKK